MRIPIFFAILALQFGPASAAELSVPTQTLSPGQSAVTAISYSSQGQAVNAIQFDLTWNPPLDLKIATGSQIGASFKNLYLNSIAPGTIRCVIAGLSQAPLADGELLRLFLTASLSSPTGSSAISTANIVASAPDGSPVTVTSAPTPVQITGPPASQQFLQAAGVLNAASLLPGPIAPGEMITLLGLIPQPSPTVSINGVPVPIIYSDSYQLNAVVPFGLNTTADATLAVQGSDQAVNLTIPTAATAPAVFAQSGSGVGPGAILNQDFTVNSSSNPASRGSVIMIYATGLGTLQSAPIDGQPVNDAIPTTLPVTAAIGNVTAPVLYAGSAPGLIAGLIQINVGIPAELAPAAETLVSLTVGGITVPLGITVAVQ